MTRRPDGASLEAELDELGVPSTKETRQLLELLATDPHALYTSLSRLSELRVPAEDALPPVDRLVAERMRSKFHTCSEPSVLRKAKPIGKQCQRLLAVLLRDVGTPTPLAELLLANGLRSATPRRIRELETEHGCFAIRTFSKDRVQHYVLDSPEPDIDKCCRYWIRQNLRNSKLPDERCVLALLSAEPGTPVPRRDLDYILPEQRSAGPGLARAAAGGTDQAVDVLRRRGYTIADGPAGLVLDV